MPSRVHHDTAKRWPGAPGKEQAPGAWESLVRLLSKESGNVVLVHPALLQSLDRGGPITPDDRRRIKLRVVDRTGKIVGAGLLPGNVTEHQLRFGLPSRGGHSESGCDDRDAQIV